MRKLEIIALTAALVGAGVAINKETKSEIKPVNQIVERPYLSGSVEEQGKKFYYLSYCEGDRFVSTQLRIPEESIRVKSSLPLNKKPYVELKKGILGVSEAIFYIDERSFTIPKTNPPPRAGQTYYDGLCKE